MKNHKFSKSSEERLIGVDEGLVMVTRESLKLSPIDFGIAWMGGRRQAIEQHELFRHAKSPCDGFLKLSRHQYGLAVDVYAYVDGEPSWHPVHLTLIATPFLQVAAAHGIKLSWGGLWGKITTDKSGKLEIKGVDMPHFQRDDVPLTKELLEWTP